MHGPSILTANAAMDAHETGRVASVEDVLVC